MTEKNNNIPPFAEEIIITEAENIQSVLVQFQETINRFQTEIATLKEKLKEEKQMSQNQKDTYQNKVKSLQETLTQKEQEIMELLKKPTTKDAETQTEENEELTEIVDTESSEESEENYYMAEEEQEKSPAQQWLDENYPKEGTCIRKNEYFKDGEVIVDNFGKKRSEIIGLSIIKQDLKGDLDLDGFINLKILCCFNNQLTSLDLSDFKELKELYCFNNQLTSLDLSDFKELKELDCSDNQLTSLDLSGNEELENLLFHANQLTFIDLSDFKELKKIFCCDNQLTSLDVSNNPKLTDLYCDADLYLNKKITGLKNTSIVRYDIRGKLQDLKNPHPVTVWKIMTDKFNDAFPEMKLMDISDLNELASQVNEITAQDKDFLAKICPLELEEFLKVKKGKIYWMLDQISNTILARGLIIQNRLYEGEDEEYEKYLDEMVKRPLNCHAMNPKNPPASLYENRERLVNQVLAGDKDLLSKLADLPYISQWVKDQLAQPVPETKIIPYEI